MSDAIERHSQREFEQLVIESLQVARAALLYFHEMVSTHERRLESESKGPVASIVVPSHHCVRDEDTQKKPDVPGTSQDEK